MDMETSGEIKLIGLDLDGTVLNSKKEITPETKLAICAAIAKGITVIPVTGRPLYGLPKDFVSIPGIRYAISSNGATTCDIITNQTLFQAHMKKELCLHILEQLKPFSCIHEVFLDGMGYVEPQILERLLSLFAGKPILSYIQETRTMVDNLTEFLHEQDSGIESISIMADTETQKDSILSTLKDIPNIQIVSQEKTDLEVNDGSTDKGAALLRLGAHLGISPNAIMACGDSGNDFSMIKAVGLGVAMGNSEDSLKKISSFVTMTNEENGVAYAIQKFALS